MIDERGYFGGEIAIREDNDNILDEKSTPNTLDLLQRQTKDSTVAPSDKKRNQFQRRPENDKTILILIK